MKKIALLLTAILMSSTLFGKDFPKGSPDFEKSYRSAMSDAKKTGKPVILVFSASWCPPCQMMKNEVYPSKAIQEFHDKFVWAYLDVDDSSNEKASEKYGVNGIPHIQFVDAEGKSIDQQVGGNSPEAFAQKLTSVLSKVKPATPTAK